MAISRNWEKTALWAALLKEETALADKIRTALKQSSCMPTIETILDSAGTTALDFTLHDDGHAFRVAEKMLEVIPDAVFPKLSPYELALLLLAAYCHDVGMTPKRRKVQLHYEFLVAGEQQADRDGDRPDDAEKADGLTDQEKADFLRWLDDDGRGIEPGLCTGGTSRGKLRLANEMLTHYSRAKHDDWSAEWMRGNLAKDLLPDWPDARDDLIALCSSHHHGHDRLVDPTFDPRLIGASGQVVHLRYLACVLRVADILEFDPERTPDVIFKHRDIHPKSQVFWWKDKWVSPIKESTAGGERYVVHARPESARIHRAIEIMLDQIDAELTLCNRLSTEKHFEKCDGLQQDLPHQWDISPLVHRVIKPKGDTYEYVDGAFRPNTDKLLQLLSGRELYGNEMVAVRELLQNAFDAVKEDIAYAQLDALAHDRAVELDSLQATRFVELSLERRGGDYWLVCTDTGVGMTKSIITDYLLVSGNSRRHDVRDLERRCAKRGVDIERTGQFGIGVLSYFMLADRVEIETRRSDACPDTEGTGWYFETDGVGDFGELRKRSDISHGTKVSLRLKDAVIGEWSESFGKLRQYLDETLLYVPCTLRLSCALLEDAETVYEQGWARTPAALADTVEALAVASLHEFRRNKPDLSEELQPESRRQKIETRKQAQSDLAAGIRECLRFHTVTGELPDDLGRFRIHIPYFEFPSGVSFAFVKAQARRTHLILRAIAGYQAVVLPSRLAMSWRGMTIHAGSFAQRLAPGSSPKHRIGFLEVDWVNEAAGAIAVHRDQITLDKPANDALNWLKEKAHREVLALVRKHDDSVFATLNAAIAGADLRNCGKPYWVTRTKNGVVWQEVGLPVLAAPMYAVDHTEGWVWGKSKGGVIGHVVSPRAAFLWSEVAPPDTILRDAGGYLVPVWTSLSQLRRHADTGPTLVRFPPEWAQVLGASLTAWRLKALWNAENPIVKSVDEDLWRRIAREFQVSRDSADYRKGLLGSRLSAVAWLLQCVSDADNREFCEGLVEHEPEFLVRLWITVFSCQAEDVSEHPAVFAFQDFPLTQLFVFTPAALKVCSSQEARDYLPKPGKDWQMRWLRRGEDVASQE